MNVCQKESDNPSAQSTPSVPLEEQNISSGVAEDTLKAPTLVSDLRSRRRKRSARSVTKSPVPSPKMEGYAGEEMARRIDAVKPGIAALDIVKTEASSIVFVFTEHRGIAGDEISNARPARSDRGRQRTRCRDKPRRKMIRSRFRHRAVAGKIESAY